MIILETVGQRCCEDVKRVWGLLTIVHVACDLFLFAYLFNFMDKELYNLRFSLALVHRDKCCTLNDIFIQKKKNNNRIVTNYQSIVEMHYKDIWLVFDLD